MTSGTSDASGVKPVPRRWRLFFSLWLPIAWLVSLLALATLAPWLPLADPTEQDLLQMLAPPDAKNWFGFDGLGRDVFSRTIYGLRISTVVALGSVAIGLLLGGALGLVAGYYRGRVERWILSVNNVLMAFPPLVLVLALMAYPGSPLLKVIVPLGLVIASAFVRIARVNTLVFAQQNFVLAARATGMGSWRIMFREILPNVVAPLLVYALLMVALAAVAEGTLSFLGLSVPPPTPSIGGMIAADVSNLREAPHAVFFPAFVFFITILSLNIVGDYFQSHLDGAER